MHRLRPERGNGREREAAAEGEQRLVNRSLEVSLELVSAMNLLLPNLLTHHNTLPVAVLLLCHPLVPRGWGF